MTNSPAHGNSHPSLFVRPDSCPLPPREGKSIRQHRLVSYMRRRIKQLVLILGSTALLLMILIAERGSHALLVPHRRALQDYHLEILVEQEAHGLIIHEFVGPGGTPGLIALPSPHPGLALKSRALRAELTRRGVSLPALGETLGTIVLLHGRHGRKEDHLPIAERFCAAGFACVFCDLPGHGDSPRPYGTFGHEERHHLPALLAAARKVVPLPAPTALFGYSQGGAIALQTAADPQNDLFAVVSIASFADLNSLITDSARKLHPITRSIADPTTALVRLGTRVRAGFDPARIRPEQSAALVTAPILVVHGEADTFIPTTHAKRIYGAISHRNKLLQLVPKAGHGDVLAVGGNALYADLTAFYLRHLP